MDTDALRRLHYAAAIACGVLAALAMHIVLTVFGVGLDAVLRDRKSTRLNSSHTEIYTLSLHDALPISPPIALRRSHCLRRFGGTRDAHRAHGIWRRARRSAARSEEHTSELQSHRDLHSFPTRRSSDLSADCTTPQPLPAAFWRHSRCTSCSRYLASGSTQCC